MTVIGKVGFQGAAVITQTEKFTILPAQIRTLNTLPVDAIVPASATIAVVPQECMVVGMLGTATYSAPVGLEIGYESLPPLVAIEGSLWDGSATVVNYSPNILTANAPRDALPYVGITLQFSSPANVTGGNASYVIFLTYTIYDLTGLI